MYVYICIHTYTYIHTYLYIYIYGIYTYHHLHTLVCQCTNLYTCVHMSFTPTPRSQHAPCRHFLSSEFGSPRQPATAPGLEVANFIEPGIYFLESIPTCAIRDYKVIQIWRRSSQLVEAVAKGMIRESSVRGIDAFGHGPEIPLHSFGLGPHPHRKQTPSANISCNPKHRISGSAGPWPLFVGYRGLIIVLKVVGGSSVLIIKDR